VSAPVFISAEAADAVLNWPDAIDAVSAVYAQPATEHGTPRRTVARANGSWLRTLPAVPHASRCFGAKLMGMSTAAASPGVEYVIVLFDRHTSRIAAFVDGSLVTAYRTAATSAAALDRLAPRQPVRLGVMGSGLEASMHVRAFAAVRELAGVVVYSPTPVNREAFARSLTRDLGVTARPVDEPREVARGATVVLAAARSRTEEPILFGDDLEDEALVVSIGSTVPEQREIDASVVARCDLMVCDTPAEVLEETGDLLAAARAGIDVRARCFSLHDLLSGAIDERVARARLPLFKSVGEGLQDIAVAELAWQKATGAGLGIELPIRFETKS
jgi:ornithine cyclodeaminase/alanine dehydrogenase